METKTKLEFNTRHAIGLYAITLPMAAPQIPETMWHGLDI